MALRFKCLILDHDDTAMDSTAAIHYPAHVAAMTALRPGVPVVDLDGWFLKNFEPGILGFLQGELGFTEEDMRAEHEIWREFTHKGKPCFYPGFREAVKVYRREGGRFVVVSHSESNIILKHYREAGEHLMPDDVFGWEAGEAHRKPEPWPVLETLRRLGLAPHEVLVVDDLKPGILMAQAAGVPSVAAGWAHQLAPIRAYMEANTLGILESVRDFASFILQR